MQSVHKEREATLIESAEYTWADHQDAQAWLTKPHPELENQSPLEAASSALGAQRAMDLLSWLFYGIPA